MNMKLGFATCFKIESKFQPESGKKDFVICGQTRTLNFFEVFMSSTESTPSTSGEMNTSRIELRLEVENHQNKKRKKEMIYF